MPNFKEIFLYTQGDKGWTEVYYSEADDLETAATFAPGFLSNFYTIRSESTQLRQITVSNVLNNRESVVVPITNGYGTGNLSGPDVTGAAAIVALNSTSIGVRRHLWLRGLMDADIVRTDAGLDNPSPRLRQKIIKLLYALIINNYRIRGKSKVGTGALAPRQIVKVERGSTPGVTKITTDANNLFTVGDFVTIGKLDPKLFPGLTGNFQCQVGTDGTVVFYINYALPQAGPINVTKGTVRKFTVNFGAINGATSGFQKFGTRSTGKSPLGGRGRRRALVTRLG